MGGKTGSLRKFGECAVAAGRYTPDGDEKFDSFTSEECE